MEYRIVMDSRYDWLEEEVDRMIREGMPSEGKVIYEGRNTLYRVDFPGKDGEPAVCVVVKEFRKPNILNSYIYTTLRKSKARRSFEHAKKLKELGFKTPAPVGYAEKREGRKLLRSIYVCLELTGVREMRNWEDFEDSEALLAAFGSEIYKLHQAGVWMKDFSPGNILWDGDPKQGYNFYYVDLNRIRFGVHSNEKLMSMFRSINLNPTETRRLARHYAAASGDRPEEAEYAALRKLGEYMAVQRRKRVWKRLRGKKPS